jgi:hypothetical protein
MFRKHRLLRQLVLPLWALGAIGAISLTLKAHREGAVAARQQTTIGTIIRHEPENHNRYGYTFHAQGREYVGWETPLAAEPRMGQAVTVYYDGVNPTENALTDFADLRDAARGQAVALLVIFTVISGGLLSLEIALRGRRGGS